MKIKKITWTHRRDFEADMICEACGTIEKLYYGYDDANYHQNVILAMKCSACGVASNTQSSSATIPAGVVL